MAKGPSQAVHDSARNTIAMDKVINDLRAKKADLERRQKEAISKGDPDEADYLKSELSTVQRTLDARLKDRATVSKPRQEFAKQNQKTANQIHNEWLKARAKGDKKAMAKLEAEHKKVTANQAYAGAALDKGNKNATESASAATTPAPEATTATPAGQNQAGIPALSDDELRKFLGGVLPDEREEVLNKLEAKGGHSIKTAYYGYDKKRANPNMRTASDYRTSLNKLLEEYASPHDLYGIAGMPAIFLDNTDPPGRGDQRGVGYNYLVNNIIYGTYVAFKPGYIEWDITDEEGEGMDSGSIPTGIVGKMFTGTLASNRPQVDQVYRDVARACRICAYMMGLDDVAFPFKLNTIGLKQQEQSWIRNRGNHGGYRSFKGNFLFTSTTGNTKNMMTAEAYRSIGQGLASIVVNRMESPDNKYGSVEIGDAGFFAFRVSGNIEFQDSITNATATNPVKELGDNMLGDTDDLIKYFAGRFGLNPHKDGAGALAYIVGDPMLPEVWNSSSYEKQYSFSIVLSTPYGNPLSVFMNIMYPMIKMCMLALPLGIGGFQTSPPICRVFSAGAINTEYGLITSLSIEKNMKTLNDAGMPTEVTMNVQVTDLNAFLYKEKAGWFNASVKLSTGFSIFLATMIGQNFSTISSGHRQRLNQSLIKVEAADQVGSWAQKIQYWWKDWTAGMFSGAVGYKDSIQLRFTKVSAVWDTVVKYGTQAPLMQTGKEIYGDVNTNKDGTPIAAEVGPNGVAKPVGNLNGVKETSTGNKTTGKKTSAPTKSSSTNRRGRNTINRNK